MFYSLRIRLLLTLMSVVVIAVGTVALFTSRATTREFQEYVERDMVRTQFVTNAMLISYNQGQGLKDLQATAEQLADMLKERVILTDGAHNVLADSDDQLVGQRFEQDAQTKAVIVTLGRIGQDNLIVSGQPEQMPFNNQLNQIPEPLPIAVQRPLNPGQDPIEASFISAVNHSLILAVTVAGLMSLVLTLVFSRRILQPIETLTAAAREMEKGDLSQRVQVRSKDEIGQLTHAFNAMVDGLEHVEQLRRNMVSDVAHELRTPLTNIRGYLEAMRDGVADPTPRLIGSLHEEALLLNRLIDDLQELALVEAGQLSLVAQRVSLSEIVEKATSAVELELIDKGLTLCCNIPADLPPIEVDPERIGQVIRNLLNNAMRHTPAGGKISISAAAADSEILVEVRDTGSGIAPEHLPYIFERFFRADRSRNRATGGAGLGLTIVKQLVKAHGGRIWAESTRGLGTVFTFALPIAAR
ncbi:MAG TPA: ATP-binding protein [Herpetosiphonaceae bacterium]